ncbi:energy transducer TonB [Luteibacter aegosomatis]|uniref:energy transducer TonB n=1 Tax=Luteibacter aegosomatis TaxID=2911537 RepID=UPI001FFB7C05|nr:energy transducer TonB [Luteibacter aegosomatis]UPG86405.1 energy transducer TonB [Luteibacter aegosomatis]
MHRSIALLCTALALTACHAPTKPANKPADPDRAGTVSYKELPAFADNQYKLKRDEQAFGAQPVDHDAPAYPASLVALQLPETTVRIKAIVDEQGRVTEVRDLDTSNDPNHSAFFAACRDAVMRWSYTPMTVVEEWDDGRGNITQKRRNAPFSLDYGFRFALVEGKPMVSSTRK